MYTHLRLRQYSILSGLPQFAGTKSKFREFAEYCRLRDQGLRAQALESLHHFLTEASLWALPERIALVDAMLVVSPGPGDMTIPHPMIDKLIIPTLHEWMAESPEASAPRRWFGILIHDVGPLKTALVLDPQDQIACEALIRFVIESVQYAVHELPSGYLGDPEEDYEALRSAVIYASALTDPVHRDSCTAELHSLIEIVERYRAQYDGQSDGAS